MFLPYVLSAISYINSHIFYILQDFVVLVNLKNIAFSYKKCLTHSQTIIFIEA